MTAETAPITLAICSNRPALLARAVPALVTIARPDDEVIVALDERLSAIDPADFPPRVRVLANDANRGLSFTRNRVLKECNTRFVLFLDDDIVATSEAVESARAALSHGLDVVGARITAGLPDHYRPWYFTAGQLHYVGCHNPALPASIWGGFLGVDVDHARLLGVDFDERLGRTAGTLGSAEDTTFVRALKAKGGRHAVLRDVEVRHIIHADRLALTYLLRRAFWQGRSEFRRRDICDGLRKEWHRNWLSDCLIPQRITLAALFGSTVTAGVAWEAVAHYPLLAARAWRAVARWHSV